MLDLPSATGSEHQPAGGAVLRIVCPTQKRLLPVLLAGFLLLFLLPKAVGSGTSEEVSWLPLVVLAAMCLLVLATLYRSFVFRDALCIYQGSEAPMACSWWRPAASARCARCPRRRRGRPRANWMHSACIRGRSKSAPTAAPFASARG